MTASQADTKAARELNRLVPTLSEMSSVEVTGLVRALFAHRKELNTAERTAREAAATEKKAARDAKAAERKEAAELKLASRKLKLEAQLAEVSERLAA
jgi:hypothetical protein